MTGRREQQWEPNGLRGPWRPLAQRSRRSTIGIVGSALLAGLLAALLAVGSAGAQSSSGTHLGVDRVGSYLSYTWVDHAHGGWDVGGELDLGTLVTRAVHLVVGLNYLKADIGPAGAEPPLGGSFHDFSTTADLRVTPVRFGIVEPFVGAGVGVHFVGNNLAADDARHARYGGTKLGAQLFGGTAVDITRDRRWAAYAEARRIAVSTVGRTTVRLGAILRLEPNGAERGAVTGR